MNVSNIFWQSTYLNIEKSAKMGRKHTNWQRKIDAILASFYQAPAHSSKQNMVKFSNIQLGYIIYTDISGSWNIKDCKILLYMHIYPVDLLQRATENERFCWDVEAAILNDFSKMRWRKGDQIYLIRVSKQLTEISQPSVYVLNKSCSWIQTSLRFVNTISDS